MRLPPRLTSSQGISSLSPQTFARAQTGKLGRPAPYGRRPEQGDEATHRARLTVLVPAVLIAITSSGENGSRRGRQAAGSAGLMSSAAAASADRSGSTSMVPWTAVMAACDTR